MKRTLLLLMLLPNLYSTILLAQTNPRQFFHASWEERNYNVPTSTTQATLPTGTTPDANVSINTSKVLAKVLPTHFGVNTPFRNGSDQLDRTHLYTNAGMGCLRFPAGSGSNEYFFDGNIPNNFAIDVNGIDGTRSSVMTPDLFVQFAKNANSEATVVVNYFYARYGLTAEDTREARVQQAADYAAEFVRKMNIELDANIRNWEIGNECYGKWEDGWDVNGSIVTGTEYGEDFRVFAEAMKAVDPTIKVGAVVVQEDKYPDWNRQVLPEVEDHADFLVVHNYFTTVKDATAETVLGSVGQIAEIHEMLESGVENYTSKARGYFPIAMTEYNSRNNVNVTMVNGLFITQILGELIKNGYGMATLWVSEWNWSETEKESKGFLARNDPDQADYSPRPTYMPYQFYKRCFGDQMVEVTSDHENLKVYASTFSSGEIGLVLVNTSDTDIDVQIDLSQVENGTLYKKAWWYDFYADNIDFNNKQFYINGQTGTTAGGGPANFADIPPYQANFSQEAILTAKKYGVQFLVLKAEKLPTPTIKRSGSHIKISSEIDGAAIYYTTDGTKPTEASLHYSNPFNVKAGTTVKALAIKNGLKSETATLEANYNVLFVMVDDLKPVLNCYGESQIISPNIDRLAAQGVVFENAYCQWPVCGPSRASILSGQTPDGTGIRNLSSQLRTEAPNLITLPEYFKNNGYLTAAAGKIFDPRNVDEAHDAASWTIPYTDPGDYSFPTEYGAFVKGNTYRVTANTASEKGPSGVKDDGYIDGQICLDALGKLDALANSNKPFFMAVGFKKPHIPFIAPEKYWDMYNPAELQLAPFQKIAAGSPDYAYHDPEPLGYVDIPDPWTYDDVTLGDNILEEEHQRKLIHGYYACVSYIDAQIGMLLDKLEEKGLDENTVVVMIGDHGYHLGDHNQWGKHTHFENALRAPLIISVPDGQARTENNPVEFTDVYPTVCDLAGLTIPQAQLQGQTLSPAFLGDNLTKDIAVSEYRSGGGSGYSFRTERYRLTLWLNGSNVRPDATAWNANNIKEIELYDYDTDPLETENLASKSAYSTVKADLLAKAEAWWITQHNFFTNPTAKSLGLPFIETFEDYAPNTSFNGDYWMTNNSIWDRVWRTTFANAFDAQVVEDAEANGTQALKFSVEALSATDGGTNIKLRTIDMTAYDGDRFVLSFKAKTDASGASKAKIGAHSFSSDLHTLTTSYQEITAVVSPINGRLFLYFNNADFATGASFNVWIDDLKVEHFTSGTWSKSALTSEWNNTANWLGGIVPTGNENVVLNAGSNFYPIISEAVSCKDMLIQKGASLEIANNGLMQINGALTNMNGYTGLKVNYAPASDAQLFFDGQAVATVEHTFQLSTSEQWHPFGTGLQSDISQLAGTALVNGTGELFIKQHTEATNLYSTADETLNANTGYFAFSTSGHTLTLLGTLSGEDQVFSALSSDGAGFHLLPNNFSTKVDLSKIQLPASHFEQGVWVYNPDSENFDLFALEGIIEPASSFFVRATQTGGDVLLPKASKTSAVQKGNKVEQALKIWVESGEDSDTAKVRFHTNAIAGKDNFDLSKVFSINGDKLSIFSEISGHEIAVNSIPNAFQGTIPLKVKLGTTGTANLHINKENWPVATDVFLQTGSENLLLGNTYSKTLTGNSEQVLSLVLQIGKKTLSVQEADDTFSIYTDQRQIYINSKNRRAFNVHVFTLSGKLIYNTSNLSGNQHIELAVPAGIYLVKLSDASGVTSRKIFVD